MTRIHYLLAVLLFACSGSPMGQGGDDTMPPDGSTHMPDGSGSGSSTLNPADCDAFAMNAVDAQDACGPMPPSGAQAALAAACKKGIQHASLCGADPAAGLACFRTEDPTDWVCQLGTVLPYCNNDLEAALGMYCLVKLGDPSCAGIACQGSLDCPSGYSCNQVTHQCFSNQYDCTGLPCDGSLDCPSGETCNQAEHACIHS